MKKNRSSPGKRCSRPYKLGRRQERADENRARVVEAACKLLATGEFLEFSLETVAREARVTRQTVHNQFGNRTGLLKAVFDQFAISGGMREMQVVMQESDPNVMLTEFIELFTRFWKSDRLTMRRIQAFAVLDSEFAAAVDERNAWRRRACSRVAGAVMRSGTQVANRERAVDLLFALTSFQFFDALAAKQVSNEIAATILRMARLALDDLSDVWRGNQ